MVNLGKTVGRGHVKPVDSKTLAITSFPVPSSRYEFPRFLGIAGYYRSFCKNFSAVATPLTDLVSQKNKFQLSSDCHCKFESLLTHAPILTAPSFDVPFRMAVDASDTGADAVLLQDGSVEHLVCYFSKKFN